MTEENLSRCPYCNSDDINERRVHTDDLAKMLYICHCYQCDKEWYEHYKFEKRELISIEE